MEQYMFIELLWIIPIVGFGIFISILVFLLHNKFSQDADPDLKREVMDFNFGIHHVSPPAAEAAAAELENRLSELEGAISSLTQSIAVQQKSMTEMNASGAVADNPELDRMLEAMRREYDAILHENRTLRSQFMRFLSDEGKTPKVVVPQTKTDLRLFEDTRSLSLGDLEDTAAFEALDPSGSARPPLSAPPIQPSPPAGEACCA